MVQIFLGKMILDEKIVNLCNARVLKSLFTHHTVIQISEDTLFSSNKVSNKNYRLIVSTISRVLILITLATTLTSCSGNRLRTITSDQTVIQQFVALFSNSSVWHHWKLSRSNKFIISPILFHSNILENWESVTILGQRILDVRVVPA